MLPSAAAKSEGAQLPDSAGSQDDEAIEWEDVAPVATGSTKPPPVTSAADPASEAAPPAVEEPVAAQQGRPQTEQPMETGA